MALVATLEFRDRGVVVFWGRASRSVRGVMMYVQFGRDMTQREITEHLLSSYADNLKEPVHFIPPIKFLEPAHGWPFRGVLVTDVGLA